LYILLKNEDMFSILISNYENSEKELHNENCLLRQTLYDIYKEVELILGVEEDEQEFDPNNSDEVTNILVQVGYDIQNLLILLLFCLYLLFIYLNNYFYKSNF